MARNEFVDDAASEDDEEAGSEGEQQQEQQQNGQAPDQGGAKGGQRGSEEGEVCSASTRGSAYPKQPCQPGENEHTCGNWANKHQSFCCLVVEDIAHSCQ